LMSATSEGGITCCKQTWALTDQSGLARHPGQELVRVTVHEIEVPLMGTCESWVPGRADPDVIPVDDR